MIEAPVPAVVVMGVSGSGKTTAARGLAAATGWAFLEGDDLHPAGNRDKLARGVALGEADRGPWLAAIAAAMAAEAARGTPLVVACSALTRAAREVLRVVPGARVRFALLMVPPAVLAARLARRHGHFASPAILGSQLDALEVPGADEAGDVVVVNGDEPPEAVLSALRAGLGV